jgi:biotin transport system substrate-specific component
MSAVICVCSLLTVPVFTVPITLQTFGIYSALFILGGKRGSIATLIYISIGALGIPVFSGFNGGIGYLFDATGGFIFGFLIAALSYWLLNFIFPKSALFKILASAISLLVLYASGILWYSFVYLGSISSISYMIFICAVYFLLPDAVKIATAYAVSTRLLRIIKI